MDDPRRLHRRAGEMTDRLISQISPAQLGLATPCSEWDVSALINHIVNGQLRFTALLTGQPGPERGEDVLGEDPAADFRSSFAGLADLLDEDGFLERTVPTPFGDGPGTQLVAMRVTELTLHSWDLASATGQSRMLDPELAAFAMAALRSRPIPRSADGPFGPPQLDPSLTLDADMLAAFAGRTVPKHVRARQLPEVTRAAPEATRSTPGSEPPRY
ncbi:MAG TPA: TIGR03086 family metal-binding protein [Streptosporangiaceae bacterium]|nr:TIGR03086 family metal-binding protein [Streptosporangiaceae bacterium]